MSRRSGLLQKERCSRVAAGREVPVPDSATTSELGDPQDVVWRNQSSRQRGEWVVAGLRNEIVGLKRQLELATKERDRISRSEEVKGETARQQALDQLERERAAHARALRTLSSQKLEEVVNFKRELELKSAAGWLTDGESW